MKISEKADLLIIKQSKDWLCSKLGISRPTLNTRLKFENWKNSEIQMILTLSKQ